ncbi:transcription elongation factor [Nadsonia fulvescens var. elongata DSM 6958]|uniref:Transcription elongation factor n=1 Tax=Nadsonia fulvescens var. elongata DSM 6958 TaxID=857566 RepID=A0A1E3PEF7_9ASCO|nr:transcription elongation factor [Nadsonia fulvescens var. elongata DSM 6958]
MSLAVKEIKTHIERLKKCTKSEDILDILNTLATEVAPTEALLRETKLGIVVNGMRTNKDPAVVDKVKKMIKSWKDAVSAQKAKKTSTSSTTGAGTGSGTTSSTTTTTTSGTNSQTVTSVSHGKPRNTRNDGVRTDVYADSVRNRCIEVTYNGLAVDSQATPSDILECAKAIESAVFIANYRTTSPDYKNKMRSLFINLKDPKNPGLRNNVLSGVIAPSKLTKMTPQEMASEELKEQIEALAKKNLFNAQGAVEQRAVTDRFTCGKCKHKRVSYYQMQTRSADEPLTTFCTCENCGNRWKFS